MSDWPFATVSIRRIRRPTAEAFKQEYFDSRQPVVIEGALDSWPALKRWSIAAFTVELGDQTVVVYSSPDRYFPGGRERGLAGERPQDDGRRFERMKFAEFARRLDQKTARWHYLYQYPASFLQQLMAGCDPPPYLPTNRKATVNLWVGDAGCVTPTHFDQADNFFCQIQGEKEFLLFAPDQCDLLYPHGSDDLYSRQSRVFDLEFPDLERFPGVRNLRGLSARLGPGDLLFMPTFYWHSVHTRSRSISVNFFSIDEERYGPLIARWRAVVADALALLPDDLSESMKAYVLRSLI